MMPTIRLAVESDVAGLLDLYKHLNPNDPPLEKGQTEKVWGEILASAQLNVLVAEKHGLLVSSCMLAIIPNLTRGARPFGIIENVVTRAEFRKQGLGGAVLANALKCAEAAGCYKVSLATGSQRPETLRFYERAGFEKGGKTHFQVNLQKS